MNTMEKQAIKTKILIPVLFLVLILVFCCGAVSAATNTNHVSVNSVSVHKIVPIEISGQVKKSSNGKPFEWVKITVKENGARIASTSTNADGTYILKFQSQNKLFTVTASAKGHKTSTQKISLKNTNSGIYTRKTDFNLGNNDAYVYKGWESNPSKIITFSDGTKINGTAINAKTTILSGITYATSNSGVNTVYLAPGVYCEHDIVISSSVNIHGENQIMTAIFPNSCGRAFYINPGVTVNIQNLIMLRGGLIGNGAAIYNDHGTLTVTNCNFTDNTAKYPSYGGAIYNNGGTLTVNSCTFTNNSAVGGGAIYNYNGHLTVTNCDFTGNVVKLNSFESCGGAIYNNRGTLTITDCKFTDNVAENPSTGGAIHNQIGSTTVTNCTFKNNSASGGGAITNSNGYLTVTCCTFIYNKASTNGGAILNDGTLTIVNSLFARNSAEKNGGAIYNLFNTLTVSDCNFYYNSAKEDGGAMYSNSGTLIITGSNFNRNTADVGGALFTASNLTINNSTFFENFAKGQGGAIYNNIDTTVNIHNSTFVRNNASLGSAIYNHGGKVDAEYNWWGDNNGPAGKISGFTVNEWIILTETTPTTNTSTLTVNP
jgi:autotransporter family porin